MNLELKPVFFTRKLYSSAAELDLYTLPCVMSRDCPCDYMTKKEHARFSKVPLNH